MKRYAVVTDPNADELFRIHEAGCADLNKREIPLYRRGRVSSITEVEAESAKAALEHELREDFSGGSEETGWEHPPENGYPGGTYGAAGFTGRILPCCKNAKEVA